MDCWFVVYRSKYLDRWSVFDMYRSKGAAIDAAKSRHRSDSSERVVVCPGRIDAFESIDVPAPSKVADSTKAPATADDLMKEGDDIIEKVLSEA